MSTVFTDEQDCYVDTIAERIGAFLPALKKDILKTIDFAMFPFPMHTYRIEGKFKIPLPQVSHGLTDPLKNYLHQWLTIEQKATVIDQSVKIYSGTDGKTLTHAHYIDWFFEIRLFDLKNPADPEFYHKLTAVLGKRKRDEGPEPAPEDESVPKEARKE
jgi:hypothetical protein